MKQILKYSIAIAALSLAPISAMAQSNECQGVPLNMKAVSLAHPRSGSLVNFAGSNGQLDPVSLLETNITVFGFPGRAVCVALTFSAQVDPGDNYGVYQASIDNVPMNGHALMTDFPWGQTTPVVFDAVNQGTLLPGSTTVNVANSRMISYTFFASVLPGTRTIRIRVAGCCSPVQSGIAPVFVRAATMIARW